MFYILIKLIYFDLRTGVFTSEMDELIQELDEETEGMQGTIYYFQNQLRQAKEKMCSLTNQEETSSEPGAASSLTNIRTSVLKMGAFDSTDLEPPINDKFLLLPSEEDDLDGKELSKVGGAKRTSNRTNGDLSESINLGSASDSNLISERKRTLEPCSTESTPDHSPLSKRTRTDDDAVLENGIPNS